MTTPADFVSSSLGLSLGEMRRRVRLHLDAVQVDSAGTSFNDPYWSDEKIDMGIEEGYDHFLQMLAMSYEGDLEQEFLLAVQAGVESYHLPYNVAKVTGVFLKDITDDDLWLPLQYSRRHDMRLEGADDGYSPSLLLLLPRPCALPEPDAVDRSTQRPQARGGGLPSGVDERGGSSDSGVSPVLAPPDRALGG